MTFEIMTHPLGHTDSSSSRTILIEYALSTSLRQPHIFQFLRQSIPNLPTSISIKLILNSDGRKGSEAALIQLPTHSDAMKCINSLHNTSLHGMKVKMKLVPSDESKSTTQSTRWLKVENINPQITEQMLLTHIQQKGDITKKPNKILLLKPAQIGQIQWEKVGDKEHRIRKDPSHALIECATSNCAHTLLRTLQMTTVQNYDDDPLWMESIAAPSGHDRREWLKHKIGIKRVMIHGIQHSVTSQQLYTLCSKYGEIVDLFWIIDSRGYRTGDAMVRMATEYQAANVFERVHDRKVNALRVSTSLVNEYNDHCNSNCNSLRISNIHPQCAEPAVYDLLMQTVGLQSPPRGVVTVYDKVTQCTTAWVVLENKRDVNLCLEKVHGVQRHKERTEMRGIGKLQIMRCQSIGKWRESAKGTTNCLRVSNVPNNVTDLILRDCIRERIGESLPIDDTSNEHYISVHITRQFMDHKVPAFAWIDCGSPKRAVQIGEALHLTKCGGNTLWVMWMAKQSRQRHLEWKGKISTVALFDLHEKTTDDEVEEFCSKFGGMPIRIEMMALDVYGRGCAVVEMKNVREAAMVFDKANGMELKGMTILVDLVRDLQELKRQIGSKDIDGLHEMMGKEVGNDERVEMMIKEDLKMGRILRMKGILREKKSRGKKQPRSKARKANRAKKAKNTREFKYEPSKDVTKRGPKAKVLLKAKKNVDGKKFKERSKLKGKHTSKNRMPRRTRGPKRLH